MYFNELLGPIFGWIDTKVYDQTKDEQKAVGWCGQVLDTNGDGRITKPWNVLDGRGNSALYQGDTTGGAGGRARTRGPGAGRCQARHHGQLRLYCGHPESG